MRAWLERSFRNRIFLTVLLVALVPLLLCDVLMTQVMISRSKHTLRTDAQEEMALLTAQLDALLTDCGDVTRALAGSTVTRSALRRANTPTLRSTARTATASIPRRTYGPPRKAPAGAYSARPARRTALCCAPETAGLPEPVP